MCLGLGICEFLELKGSRCYMQKTRLNSVNLLNDMLIIQFGGKHGNSHGASIGNNISLLFYGTVTEIGIIYGITWKILL